MMLVPRNVKISAAVAIVTVATVIAIYQAGARDQRIDAREAAIISRERHIENAKGISDETRSLDLDDRRSALERLFNVGDD